MGYYYKTLLFILTCWLYSDNYVACESHGSNRQLTAITINEEARSTLKQITITFFFSLATMYKARKKKHIHILVEERYLVYEFCTTAALQTTAQHLPQYDILRIGSTSD